MRSPRFTISHQPLIEDLSRSLQAILERRPAKRLWNGCIKCGKPTKRPFWCSSRCGRQAHYLKFSVRLIQKGELKAKAA
jgi:hypothetical protein